MHQRKARNRQRSYTHNTRPDSCFPLVCDTQSCCAGLSFYPLITLVYFVKTGGGFPLFFFDVDDERRGEV